jgi:hypothetical protein
MTYGLTTIRTGPYAGKEQQWVVTTLQAIQAQLGQVYDWLSTESARIDAMTYGLTTIRTGPYAGKEQQWMVTTLQAIQTKLDALPAPAPVVLSDADRQAIIDGVAQQIGVKLGQIPAKPASATPALDS